MIIEQLSICAPKGQRQQIASALTSITGPTQVQPGCLKCRLLQNWRNQDEFVMDANWATTEDLTRHLQSDAYKRLLLLMELSPVPPVLQFYTVEEINGLDLVEKARNQSADPITL